MVEPNGSQPLTFGRRLGSLPIVVVALLLGNIVGTIFIAISGFNALDYDKPGGAVLGAAQGGIGAYLAFLGCQHFLKDHRYASLWLAAYVVLVGLVILFGFYVYSSEGMSLSREEGWQTVAGLANAVVIEITRRTLLKEGV